MNRKRHANPTLKTSLPKRRSSRCPSKSRPSCDISLDLATELKALKSYVKHHQKPGDQDLAQIATGCSKSYSTLKDEVIEDSVRCAHLFEGKWTKFLEPVPFKCKNGDTVTVPKIISVCSGNKTKEKIELANQFMIDWQSKTRKKGKNNKCPFYQPCTQSQRLRTFIGTMSKKFFWDMKLEDFTEDKMLVPFMEKLFEQRRKKFKLVGYARPNSSRRLSLNDRKKISLAMFDESDARQHQMKILFGCGAKWGFRGQKEHWKLEVMDVIKGEFPEGHPYQGTEYYGLSGFEDKTKKLSLSNNYLNDFEEVIRCPYIPDDPENLAGSIKRYLEKVTPGQQRFYCKVMSSKAKRKYVEAGGDEKHEFMVNTPLGKGKIKELFDDGANILGLSCADEFYPHSLRAMMITELANNPSVSLKETVTSARHSNLTSSLNYQHRDGESEVAKFSALRMNASSKHSSGEQKPVVSDGNCCYCFALICCFFYFCCCFSHVLLRMYINLSFFFSKSYTNEIYRSYYCDAVRKYNNLF